MRTKRLAPMLALAACGVLLASGSAAAVNVNSAAAARAAVPRGATTTPTQQRQVFFTSYANDDLPGATVVLSGAIGDFGDGVSVLPNGTVDPEHSNQFRLALTQGSFRILIGPLHVKFLEALGRAPYSLKTCSGHVAVTGSAPVVQGSGTGAYKAITGNFTLTITGNEADAKPGCHPFSGTALLAQTIFIAGPGTISLPAPALSTGAR